MSHARLLGTINVNKNRFAVGRQESVAILLHTSEQAVDLTPSDDDEALCKVMTYPGTRISASGNVYGSSYNRVIADDGYWMLVDESKNLRSYSAPPANTWGIHLCFPGRAGKTREQWLSGVHRARITRCAELMVDLHDLYGIPLKHLTDAELKNVGTTHALAEGGWSDHHAVTLGWHQTDHWDIGEHFPHDVLQQDITTILNPPAGVVYDLARPVLSEGSKGGEVIKLQQMLKFWGAYPYNVDGSFGPRTKQGVVAFQNGLNKLGYNTGPADGVWNWLEWSSTQKWYASLGVST